jgi:hypothetical protein
MLADHPRAELEKLATLRTPGNSPPRQSKTQWILERLRTPEPPEKASSAEQEKPATR